MDQQIKSYITNIIAELHCSEEEKQELAAEMTDHLMLLKKEYMDKGLSESDAIRLAMESFGNHKQISSGLNRSLLLDLGRMVKITTWSLFSIYSIIVLWKLLIVRLLSSLLQGYSYYFNVWHNESNISIFNKEIFLHNTNFIPLKNILNYIIHHDHYNLNIVIDNLFGNILAFVPLGIFLPLLFKKFQRFTHFAMFTFLINFSIEFLQYVLKIGQGDIDDIILYSIGECVGYMFMMLLMRVAMFRKIVT